MRGRGVAGMPDGQGQHGHETIGNRTGPVEEEDGHATTFTGEPRQVPRCTFDRENAFEGDREADLFIKVLPITPLVLSNDTHTLLSFGLLP